MENKFKNTKIEYHILQTFPVTCLNRDDIGTPKTAIVGGVKRARVSSQCWKRQVRLMLHDAGVSIAVRTKKVADSILEFVDDKDDPKTIEAANVIAEALSDDTLIYFSKQEAKKLAEYIKANKVDAKDKNLASNLAKYLKAELKDKKGIDGMDVALFGRMIAKAPTLNLEGAASFSHAITTHRIASEVDFFTAIDDKMPEDSTGSGHMGSLEFTSGTFYRYVSLNLGILYENLGNEEDLKKAVIEFTKALYLAVPMARQRTQAGYCLWDYAHVYVRKGQEIQLSFDKPVKSEGSGFLSPSIKEMKEKLSKNKQMMGSLFGEKGEYIFGDTNEHGIDGLLDFIDNQIKEIE
ncbi:MAG: type I-E CRISPR-associated protein Cas7/Cse4/CasC [Candidatus Ornithospirochaeta sp.]